MHIFSIIAILAFAIASADSKANLEKYFPHKTPFEALQSVTGTFSIGIADQDVPELKKPLPSDKDNVFEHKLLKFLCIPHLTAYENSSKGEFATFLQKHFDLLAEKSGKSISELQKIQKRYCKFRKEKSVHDGEVDVWHSAFYTEAHVIRLMPGILLPGNGRAIRLREAKRNVFLFIAQDEMIQFWADKEKKPISSYTPGHLSRGFPMFVDVESGRAKPLETSSQTFFEYPASTFTKSFFAFKGGHYRTPAEILIYNSETLELKKKWTVPHRKIDDEHYPYIPAAEHIRIFGISSDLRFAYYEILDEFGGTSGLSKMNLQTGNVDEVTFSGNDTWEDVWDVNVDKEIVLEEVPDSVGATDISNLFLKDCKNKKSVKIATTTVTGIPPMDRESSGPAYFYGSKFVDSNSILIRILKGIGSGRDVVLEKRINIDEAMSLKDPIKVAYKFGKKK